jgi:hypothetical protein
MMACLQIKWIEFTPNSKKSTSECNQTIHGIACIFIAEDLSAAPSQRIIYG